MQCPQCHRDNPVDARFCTGCGKSLEVVCPSCQTPNLLDSNFCKSCGRPLQKPPHAKPDLRSASPQSYIPKYLAEKILTSRHALEGERKQATILFCDIVNSTTIAERLEPEAMHNLLNHFFEMALNEIHRYEGTINKFLGDGFMALFGVPVSHEDHARRAALAALGIQRNLLAGTLDLQARIGLNTGLVVVGSIGDNLEMDYTAIGDTSNVAARLQALAESNSILISEATARSVRGYVRVEDLGPVQVKGRIEPVTVYKVLGLGRRRSPLDGLEERSLSRFVGRQRELADLQALLDQVESGHSQVVGVVAEPGMGKSRLLYEFRRSLVARPLTYLEGRCLSFGSAIPYLPVLDIVKNNCGILETDTPEEIAEKVRTGLQEVGIDSAEAAPYILQLLGVKDGSDRLAALSAEAIKSRTFETLRQWALRGSQQRQIIFVVEDLHWIDKTSDEYLESLVESTAGARVMLLVTYRPGYRPPWIERSYASQISLRRLTPNDSLCIIRSVFQTDQVPQTLEQVILDKAEGNPFFLEELSKAVAEHEPYQMDTAVPDTIQGVLMARIDRLPDETKEALQTASVLGREFSLRLLNAIWEGPGPLEPYLEELERLEFIY